MSFIEDNIQSYLTQIQGPIAVACSGGLDSTVLLHCLIKQYPKELLTCIHIDHALREDSHKAAIFLKNFCSKNDIHYLLKTLKPREIKADELSARKARYQFFEEACNAKQISNLFLGHNLNDQAETILFRLFRGTNTSGLQGMAVSRSHGSFTLHRPMLQISRIEIAQYAQINQIDFIEDYTNTNLDYARNRIRSEIIPQALKINPRAIENIAQLASLVKMEQEYINYNLQQAKSKLGTLPWDLALFRTIEPVIQRKLLELHFTTNIAFINDFMQAVREGGFHRINFAKGCFFTIKQKTILLEDLGCVKV